MTTYFCTNNPCIGMRGNTDKINASLSAYHSHKDTWEGGRTHPTGPVFRLLDILSAGEDVEYIVAK